MTMLQNAPYQPQSLNIPKYAFIGTLNKQEKEEAAARLLTICKDAGQWIGVKWKDLAQQMTSEVEMSEKVRNISKENFSLRNQFDTELHKWKRANLLTFGIYSLFVAKPVEPIYQEELEWEIPFSQITTLGVIGLQNVINGLHMLIEEGYVEKKREGDGDIFSPTIKLLDAVSKFAKV